MQSEVTCISAFRKQLETERLPEKGLREIPHWRGISRLVGEVNIKLTISKSFGMCFR